MRTVDAGAEGVVIMALVVSVVLLAAPATEPLEVEASLSGYNLPPLNESRCCSFRLKLDAHRKLSVDVGGRVTESTITPQQLVELRLAIESAKFFSLPEAVPSHSPIDGDEHRMRIQLGSKQHTVTLYDWPKAWKQADYLSGQELDQTRRAHSVWKLLRALVMDPDAIVQ